MKITKKVSIVFVMTMKEDLKELPLIEEAINYIKKKASETDAYSVRGFDHHVKDRQMDIGEKYERKEFR